MSEAELAEAGEEYEPEALQLTVPDILFELADGHPLDFVKYDPANQSFALEPEAQEFLLEFGGQVAFVVNMGQRRIGKTALFNKCLDISPAQSAFRENARGLKLWSKPIFNAAENKHVFFVDCEGRDDEAYQEFCWVFGFFFASLLLFSTSGEIDDATWAEFRPLEAVAKKVVFRDTPLEGNLHNVAHLAPRLCWLVRDFPCADDPEAAAQPDAYMNAHLHAEGGDAYTKRQLASFFRQRGCLLLPPAARPQAADPWAALTDEGVRVVKDAIFSRTPVKLWDGAPLNARLAVYLLTVTIDQFCRGERLDFERILAEIARSELHRANEEALEAFEAVTRARLSAPLRGAEVFAVLREAREAAARVFFGAQELARRLPEAERGAEQFFARLREAEAPLLAAQEAAAAEHNDALKDALEAEGAAAIAAAEATARSAAQPIADCLERYVAGSRGVDDVSPALILASTLLEKALQRFTRPVADAEPPDAREALEAVTHKREELLGQKSALEREIVELKQSLQTLKAKSDGDFGKLSSLKREFEKEVEKKGEYERMLSRQKSEMEALSATLKKMQEKKGWCGA